MAEHYCVVGQICPPGLLKESMQFYQGRLNIVALKKNHVKNLFELYCIVGQNCVPGTYQAQQGRLKLAAARKCRADLLAAIFDPNQHNAAQFCLAFGRGLFCPLLSFKLFKAISRPWFFLFPPLAASPCHLWKRLRNSASTSTTITFGSMHLHNQI